MLKSAQLRQQYLDFFGKKNHALIPSAGLVPENDPTTLFTGSGMQPLLPYLLGAQHPMGKRATNSQKCFRSQDIEEVGDNRHTTFFEMLGNWSFGDYFKKEQLDWFFEFLVKVVGLDPSRLHVSVYKGDEAIGVPKDQDSPAIWQKLFAQLGLNATVVDDPLKQGIAGKIFYYGNKNWWSRSGEPSKMPVGEPGGPDSEVFYDFGAELKLHEHSIFHSQPCHPNCDCGRFLEIGNSVFMQYQKSANGDFVELASKNVDFGGGLERILAAANQNPDVFCTDLFSPIIAKLESISGQKYSSNTKAFRIIADHVKAGFMLAVDGVYPASKEQGYFARRLLRRAIRYGKILGINKPFLSQILPSIVSIYHSVYPVSNQEKIAEVFSLEEAKFGKTLDKGLKEIAKLQSLDGKVAFALYETYGFPLELTQEIAQERGQNIETDAFKQAFLHHQSLSRAGSLEKFKGGLANSSSVTTRYHTATHLLQASLRLVLGDSVRQMGSHITDKRARFDFAYAKPMTEAEKESVERQINTWVTKALSVTLNSMPKQEAINSGAIAFFKDRYPDLVTIYTIGQTAAGEFVSRELCGGPHVKNTKEIGKVKLIKEQSSGAGIRRVYLTFVE